MIALTRLAEPAILMQKKEQWTEVFLTRCAENPNRRPPSRQYGHRIIRHTLAAMSSRKCFYCERKLDEEKGEVDHYIEVAEAPEKAFKWENLYLSCRDCNGGKLPNSSIPVADCLDPCDPAVDPAEHLTFDDDVIRPKNESLKGAQTIRKYQLDREGLNYLRSKQLLRFHKVLITIQNRQVADGRRSLSTDEKEILAHFKTSDHAYSLMFVVLLERVGI